jgi:hypothetical protein
MAGAAAAPIADRGNVPDHAVTLKVRVASEDQRHSEIGISRKIGITKGRLSAPYPV